MKKVVVSLNQDSIQDAINELKKYQAELPTKKAEFLRRLAEEGADAIREIYSAWYGTVYAGHASVPTVTVEMRDNSAAIVAEGEDIAFLEFGTGKYAGYNGNAPVDISPGSWSQSELGQGHFIPGQHEFWFFRGVRYDGSFPAQGFIRAVERIRQSEERIAKEVFG